MTDHAPRRTTMAEKLGARADYWLANTDGAASIEAGIDWDLVSDLRAELSRLREAIETKVAQFMCPTHGNAACPEEYMLMHDGTPSPSYRDIWDESMRCGQRPTADDILARTALEDTHQGDRRGSDDVTARRFYEAEPALLCGKCGNQLVDVGAGELFECRECGLEYELVGRMTYRAALEDTDGD